MFDRFLSRRKKADEKANGKLGNLAASVTTSAVRGLMSLPISEQERLMRNFRIRHRGDLERLENEVEIDICLGIRRAALRSIPIALDPDSGRHHDEVRAFLDEFAGSILTGALQSVFYGRSVLEIKWQPGQLLPWVPVEVEELPFHHFRWKDGSLRYHPPSGEGGVEGYAIQGDPRRPELAYQMLLTIHRKKHGRPDGMAKFVPLLALLHQEHRATHVARSR